ncbi:hypothetical protein [uncultured Nocardioides sp.]|uniref:hypothetical protein n=1 Tax=uncultured Nocardioides sp. TaxID=198441 RepID=UPI0026326B3F|nr:hypothetical protein [uncultured Nocardioides sp.]
MKRSRSLPTAATGGLVAAIVLPLAAAAPASAAEARDNDPVQDVTVVTRWDGGGFSTATDKTAEIRSSTVTHGGRVVVRIAVRELEPDDQVRGSTLLRTPGGDTYLFQSERNSFYTDRVLYKNDRAIDCGGRGLRSTFNAGVNLIRLEVARRCLGNPSSIRWGAYVEAYEPDGDIVADDARRRGHTPEIAQGAKIRSDSVAYH